MFNKLLTIFCLFCTLWAQAQKKEPAKAKPAPAPVQPKIDYTQIGAPMPEMLMVSEDTIIKTYKKNGNWWVKIRHKDVKTIKTNTYTNKDFENNANLFVMEFNPNCSHCVEETEILKNNIVLFKKTKLVLMANSRMKEYLPDFIKQREIKKYPVITIGYDSTGFINETFLYKNLPQINVYSPDRKLIKIFNGDVVIDSLKRYIE